MSPDTPAPARLDSGQAFSGIMALVLIDAP